MTTSIIMLCHNQQHLTREAIESLYWAADRRPTADPWELILVDNASSDGTREYLLALERWRGEVRLVLHDSNLGYPGGMNSAIRLASGERLALCNNDLVFTEGWLERLLPHLDDPAVGMVTPSTNLCGNPGQIAAGANYKSNAGMWRFADGLAREYAGQAAEQPMLGFFCIAARREIFDPGAVGLFDEQFRPGYFEDDDYCIRLRRAGYRLFCARDVYVHHGHEGTFRAMDRQFVSEVLRVNRAKFERKWGVKWTGDKGEYRYIDEAVAKPEWEVGW